MSKSGINVGPFRAYWQDSANLEDDSLYVSQTVYGDNGQTVTVDSPNRLRLVLENSNPSRRTLYFNCQASEDPPPARSQGACPGCPRIYLTFPVGQDKNALMSLVEAQKFCSGQPGPLATVSAGWEIKALTGPPPFEVYWVIRSRSRQEASVELLYGQSLTVTFSDFACTNPRPGVSALGLETRDLIELDKDDERPVDDGAELLPVFRKLPPPSAAEFHYRPAGAGLLDEVELGWVVRGQVDRARLMPPPRGAEPLWVKPLGSSWGHTLMALDESFTLKIMPGPAQEGDQPAPGYGPAVGREVYETLTVSYGQPRVEDLWVLRVMDWAQVYFQVANVGHVYINQGVGRVEADPAPDQAGRFAGTARIPVLPEGLASPVSLTCLGPKGLVTETIDLTDPGRCLTLGIFFGLVRKAGPEGREEYTFELDWLLEKSGFQEDTIKLSAPGFENIEGKGLSGHEVWTFKGVVSPLIFQGTTEAGRRVELEIEAFDFDTVI